MKRLNSYLRSFLHLLLIILLSISTVSATNSWGDVDAFLEQDNFPAAIQHLDKQLEISRAQHNQDEWAVALIRGARLRALQSEPEAAIEYLSQQAWPKQPVYQILLHTRLARELEHYLNQKSWDRIVQLDQRQERLMSVKDRSLADLKHQLKSHYQQAFTLAEQHDIPVDSLKLFLEPGDYPSIVRGNLLEYVGALWINFLCDDVYWTDLEREALKTISLESLISSFSSMPALNSSLHPLQQTQAITGRLRHRHLMRTQAEAAFEASRYHIASLRRYFAGDNDLMLLSQALSEQMKALGPQYAWWTMGQYQLAEFARQLDQRDALVKAHALAAQGSLVHPDSEGARRSRELLQQLEHREYAISSQGSRALNTPSIKVDYRNIQRLYFRAWKIDRSLPAELNDGQKKAVIGALLSKDPEASWSKEFPDHWDLRQHSMQLTPEISSHGQWLVLASPQEDFIGGMKHLQLLELTLSRFVARANYLNGEFQVAVYDGQHGRAMSDVTVELLDAQATDINVLASARTDLQGVARLKRQLDADYFQIRIRQGEDRSVIPVPGLLPLSDEKKWLIQPANAVLMTDRAVYAGQALLKWSVIAAAPAVSDKPWPGAYADQAGWLKLYDANNELVADQSFKTGAAGTASGEFALNELLNELNAGEWMLESSWNGRALIQVAAKAVVLPSLSLKQLPSELALGSTLTVIGQVNGIKRPEFSMVHWKLRRSEYQVSHETPYDELQSSMVVGNQRVRPDQNGKFSFDITLEAAHGDDAELHNHYELAVDLLDDKGIRSQVREVLHGLKPYNRLLINASSNFVMQGEAANFEIIKADSAHNGVQGQTQWYLYRLLAPGQQVSAELVREANSALSQWLTGPLQSSGKLEHLEQGIANLTLEGLLEGAYRLRVIDPNPELTPQKDWDFLVSAEGASHKFRTKGVLLSQHSQIAPGNTLRLMVGSGLKGQWTRLSILHRGQQLASQMLSPGVHVLEYPVLENHQGGLNFNLEWVRDNELYSEAIFVDVPWALKQLTLQLKALSSEDVADAFSTDQVKQAWILSVSDIHGQAVSEVGSTTIIRIQAYQEGDKPTPLTDLSRLYARDSQRIMTLSNNVTHYSQRFSESSGVPEKIAPLKLPHFIYSAKNNVRYSSEASEFMIFSMLSNTDESTESFQTEASALQAHKPVTPSAIAINEPEQFFYSELALDEKGQLTIPVPDALQGKQALLQVLVVTPELKSGQLSVVVR